MKQSNLYTLKAFFYLALVLTGVSLFSIQLFAVELQSSSLKKKKLDGTQWHLIEFTSMDDTKGIHRVDDPSKLIMGLNYDGSLSFQLNSKYMYGKWDAKPSEEGISGQLSMTLHDMPSTSSSLEGIEAQIVKDTSYIRGYLLKDGRLHLSLMADGGIYIWEPHSLHNINSRYISPQEGGPRNWKVTGMMNERLNLREHPSMHSKIIDKYTPDTILDNLGCKKGESGVWCDVQKLGGGARGYVFSKYIEPAVSPDGTVAMGIDDSALRAGENRFDASGTVPCSNSKKNGLKNCSFSVARSGGGYATVVVTRPDGMKRAIFFRFGKPLGADTSQADGYPEFRSHKSDDWHLIHVGREFYKIPDAVIYGG